MPFAFSSILLDFNILSNSNNILKRNRAMLCQPLKLFWQIIDRKLVSNMSSWTTKHFAFAKQCLDRRRRNLSNIRIWLKWLNLSESTYRDYWRFGKKEKGFFICWKIISVNTHASVSNSCSNWLSQLFSRWI